MVMMLATCPVIFQAMVCIWGSFVPARTRMLRLMEDWAFSKIPIAIEMFINVVIVLLSVVLLVCTAAEKPNAPVRVWMVGHAVQCLVHMILIRFVYRHVAGRRRRRAFRDLESFVRSFALARLAYICDFFNMLVWFVWLIGGFFWIQPRDKLLPQNAPWLHWWYALLYFRHDSVLPVKDRLLRFRIEETWGFYWTHTKLLWRTLLLLCTSAITFSRRMFTRVWVTYYNTYVMIRLAMVTSICCMSCVIVILRYIVQTVAEQEGAFKEDLNVLPKYRFHMSRNSGMMVPMNTSSGYPAAERVILPEDSECCICLCSYEDGIELHALLCNRHFHVTCIEKWLKINANCPICEFNILTRSV